MVVVVVEGRGVARRKRVARRKIAELHGGSVMAPAGRQVARRAVGRAHTSSLELELEWSEARANGPRSRTNEFLILICACYSLGGADGGNQILSALRCLPLGLLCFGLSLGVGCFLEGLGSPTNPPSPPSSLPSQQHACSPPSPLGE